MAVLRQSDIRYSVDDAIFLLSNEILSRAVPDARFEYRQDGRICIQIEKP